MGGLTVAAFAEAAADVGRQALIMRNDHEYQLNAQEMCLLPMTEHLGREAVESLFQNKVLYTCL